MNFIKNVFTATWRTIKNTIRSILNNFEPLIIMSASAVGVAAILQQVPFHYSVPLWMDAPLVLPFIAVLFIMSLVSIYQWRMRLCGAYPRD